MNLDAFLDWFKQNARQFEVDGEGCIRTKPTIDARCLCPLQVLTRLEHGYVAAAETLGLPAGDIMMAADTLALNPQEDYIRRHMKAALQETRA